MKLTLNSPEEGINIINCLVNNDYKYRHHIGDINKLKTDLQGCMKSLKANNYHQEYSIEIDEENKDFVVVCKNINKHEIRRNKINNILKK